MWQFRIPTWIILYLLALLVQTALLPQIFPVGYVPNLVLPLTVIIALYETPRRGLMAGLIGGLMQDVWAGRLWGINALTFALLGFAVAHLESRIVRDNIFVPVGGCLSPNWNVGHQCHRIVVAGKIHLKSLVVNIKIL